MSKVTYRCKHVTETNTFYLISNVFRTVCPACCKKMYVVSFSEILVSVYQTEWRQMSEDNRLHTDYREYINHTTNIISAFEKRIRHTF
jgi:hypothetical protein